jgi:geranylgeranyl diphosphate synthase type II
MTQMNTASADALTCLATWIESRRALVEAAIARLLPAPPDCPSILDTALRYSALGGGKRLRPLLTLAAAEAVCGNDEEAQTLALPAACALELIHTYSLIHDDLPAMDDDSLRRGRPTSHVVFGEGMAILAGDGLLTEAFSLLAREPVGDTAALVQRKLQTVAIIARAAGVAGMVGGQAIDLHAARPHGGAAPPQFDAASLRDMHARKTGALITASVTSGATMAGASAAVVGSLDRFGREIGLAFQIVDDVLDVEGTDAELGKTAGKDAMAGKPTYPSLFGLAESKVLAREAIDRAKAALAEAGLAGQLPAIADWIVERTN